MPLNLDFNDLLVNNSGGLFDVNVDNINVNVDMPDVLEWAKKIGDSIRVPLVGEIIGNLWKVLDGCNDDFDKQRVYNEEVGKAKNYINTMLSFLNDTSLGSLDKRLTRADKFYSYVWYHHSHRKNIVKCGVNKYAEAIKYKIAEDFLKKFRSQYDTICTKVRKQQRYYEPLKARDVLTVDYYEYKLKPDADQIVKRLNTNGTTDTKGGVPINTLDTNTPKSTNNANGLILAIVAFLMLFGKNFKKYV